MSSNNLTPKPFSPHVINAKTNTTNSKVKRLVALAQKAKARREEDVFIVEGPRMFQEAPKDWIKEVYVSASFLAKNDKVLLENIRYEVVSDEVFNKTIDEIVEALYSLSRHPF